MFEVSGFLFMAPDSFEEIFTLQVGRGFNRFYICFLFSFFIITDKLS